MSSKAVASWISVGLVIAAIFWNGATRVARAEDQIASNTATIEAVVENQGKLTEIVRKQQAESERTAESRGLLCQWGYLEKKTCEVEGHEWRKQDDER